MHTIDQNQILATSSGWVAAVLNFLPGLGAGYIYQRRWKAYWNTIAISAAWFFFALSVQGGLDPAVPVLMQNDQIGFYGLIVIAMAISFEAVIALRRAREGTAA